MKKKFDGRYIIAIIVLIAIGAPALYFGLNQPFSPDTTVSFKSGVLKTNLVSGADGETHTLEAKFVVELDREFQGRVNNKELFSVIQESLYKLDYDTLAGKEGLSYLKQHIIESLKADDRFDDDVIAAIEGIYITNIISDFPFEDEGSPNNVSDTYKGLFQNIK